MRAWVLAYVTRVTNGIRLGKHEMTMTTFMTYKDILLMQYINEPRLLD